MRKEVSMHAATTGTEVPTLRAVTLDKIIWCDPGELDYHAPSARQHSEDHIKCFERTIRHFCGAFPVVTDGTCNIIAGQGRVEAARRLGITAIPTLPLAWLTKKERKHYVNLSSMKLSSTRSPAILQSSRARLSVDAVEGPA